MLLAVGGCADSNPPAPAMSVKADVASCSDAHEVFVETGEMIEPRSWHAATLLADGRVLISGGTLDWGWGERSGHFKNSTEIYDPKTNSFHDGPGMALARSAPVAVLLRNDKVLVAGGYSGSEPDDTAEIFDPASNNFSPAGPVPISNRVNLSPLAFAVALGDGRALIGDGHLLEIYDFKTGSFSRADSSSTASHPENLAVKLNDGKVLLACIGTEDRSAEIYDPKSGQFSATGKMLDAWSTCEGALLPDGRIFILGDEIEYKGKRAQIYDPKTGTFSRTSEYQDALSFEFNLIGLGDGRVLIILTTEPVTADSLTVEIYDSQHDRFSTVGTISPPRHGYSLTKLGDGRVLVSGGSTYSKSFKRSLLFCP